MLISFFPRFFRGTGCVLWEDCAFLDEAAGVIWEGCAPVGKICLQLVLSGFVSGKVFVMDAKEIEVEGPEGKKRKSFRHSD